MRTMKPLMTILGAAALLAATVVPAAAQDTAVAAIPAQGTLRYTPLITCDFGQPSGFDLAPCAADDAGIHLEFTAPIEIGGTLDGVGSFSGVLTVRADNTFIADATAIFVGEVEGCGTGNVQLLLADHQGYYDDAGTPVWTEGSWTIVPGGSLPVSGFFEALGPETQLDFPTGQLDYTGELTCDDAGG